MFSAGSMSAEPQPVSVRERAGIALGLMFGLLALYLVIGWVQLSEGAAITLPTSIDERVPFAIGWLPLYIFMLPMSWAPACAFVDRRCLMRWVISVLLMYAVAIPIWLVMPVTVPRVPLEVVDYWTYALDIMRRVDPPVNCLPSMHVAVATLAGLLIRRADRLVGYGCLALIPFIWYSTMALDQHWFVDGLVGLVLAVTVETATHRWMKIPAQAQVALDRRAHLVWIAPYVLVMAGAWVTWVIGR